MRKTTFTIATSLTLLLQACSSETSSDNTKPEINSTQKTEQVSHSTNDQGSSQSNGRQTQKPFGNFTINLPTEPIEFMHADRKSSSLAYEGGIKLKLVSQDKRYTATLSVSDNVLQNGLTAPNAIHFEQGSKNVDFRFYQERDGKEIAFIATNGDLNIDVFQPDERVLFGNFHGEGFYAENLEPMPFDCNFSIEL